MDIISLQFEEPLMICIAGTVVKILAFKTQDNGNVKFGVDAPREIQVNREEILVKKKEFLSIEG